MPALEALYTAYFRFGTALMFCAIVLVSFRMDRVPGKPPLVGIGPISEWLYLRHLPVFCMLGVLSDGGSRSDPPRIAAAWLATFTTGRRILSCPSTTTSGVVPWIRWAASPIVSFSESAWHRATSSVDEPTRLAPLDGLEDVGEVVGPQRPVRVWRESVPVAIV